MDRESPSTVNTCRAMYHSHENRSVHRFGFPPIPGRPCAILLYAVLLGIAAKVRLPVLCAEEVWIFLR
jgi:hypothetical protein